MAGETIKAEAVCLTIRPFSRTSHVVNWLTDAGCVATLVKGAVRPKSAFLGQYDLNYTCEIVYYARAHGELHALREASPLKRRDALRGDYRALALAEHFRYLAGLLAPTGAEAAEWLRLVGGSLDALAARAGRTRLESGAALAQLLAYELAVLELVGLKPELSEGALALRGERSIPVAPATFACLRDPYAEKNLKILLDAARVIGVFYSFHLDTALAQRRAVLGLISNHA